MGLDRQARDEEYASLCLAAMVASNTSLHLDGGRWMEVAKDAIVDGRGISTAETTYGLRLMV